MWKMETVNRGVLIRRRPSGEGKIGKDMSMKMVWETATEWEKAWETAYGIK